MKKIVKDPFAPDADGWVALRDGTKCQERYACHCQDCERRGPLFADDRYSLGVYAGRMCDTAWARSGYRDEGPEGFDSGDAGECLREDY
jgi:hypothetical protein